MNIRRINNLSLETFNQARRAVMEIRNTVPEITSPNDVFIKAPKSLLFKAQDFLHELDLINAAESF